MENILRSNILHEKRKAVLIAIVGAVLVSSLVLAVSFGFEFMKSSNKVDNNLPDSSSDYTLALDQFMLNQYENNHIVQFEIGGNLTSSIHQNLIYSVLVFDPVNQAWNATMWISVNQGQSEEMVNASFTDTQLNEVHSQFRQSLSQTQEVQKPDLGEPGGSLQFALAYTVLFDDNTGLEFQWLIAPNWQYISTTNITWTSGFDGVAQKIAGNEVHYISPASAFDPFLDQLRDMYSVLGN